MKVLSIVGTRIKDTDLAWLAGIIDGEGNLGFEQRTPMGASITPRVTITNTNKLMIDNILRIYGGLGVNYYCQKRKRNCSDGHIRVPCYDLQVHRLREIIVLLEAVSPFLVNKKDRAELMAGYCTIRVKKRDMVSCNRLAPYGEEERSIARKLTKMNVRGVVV